MSPNSLLFAVCCVVIVSARLRGTGGGNLMGSEEETGASLGALVSQIVRDTQGKPSIVEGIRKTLDSNTEVLVNPRVTEIIGEANALMASTPDKDYLCQRDWTQACPDGWQQIGSLCQAPPLYDGACERQKAFVSIEDKRRFSLQCAAPWACQSECEHGRNYSGECPLGWVPLGGGFCERANETDADPRCAIQYSFAELSTAEKQELAATCDITWPCMSTCDEDFRAPCPETWTPVDTDYCVAPATYAGACSHGFNGTGMTPDQKRAFASHCGVTFPCSDIGLGNRSRELADVDHAVEAKSGPIGYETGRIGMRRHRHDEAASRSWLPDGAIGDDGQIFF